MSFEPKTGLSSKFLFGAPGSSYLERNLAVEIQFEPSRLIKAALHIRRHASPHLQSASVDVVRKALMDFVTEYFGILSGESYGRGLTGSFADFISPPIKAKFALAMASSSLFVEPRRTVLFPLVTVQVDQAFDTSTFFLVPSDGLTKERLPPSARISQTNSESFPPIDDWQGVRYNPASWLGIRAATLDAAKQLRGAVLGAIALLPHPAERYQFTGRNVIGGSATFFTSWSISAVGEPHTPAIYKDIVIGPDDQAWLTSLATKLASPAKADKKQIRALEYYYRAWTPDPIRRLPVLFAALDAIYGDAGAATQAVVDAVGPIMGPSYTFDRLKLLLSLRASVVHGGAPNVYESTSYHKYYERYEEDATRDLELIVARCLQTFIFAGALTERPYPLA